MWQQLKSNTSSSYTHSSSSLLQRFFLIPRVLPSFPWLAFPFVFVCLFFVSFFVWCAFEKLKPRELWFLASKSESQKSEERFTSLFGCWQCCKKNKTKGGGVGVKGGRRKKGGGSSTPLLTRSLLCATCWAGGAAALDHTKSCTPLQFGFYFFFFKWQKNNNKKKANK